MNEQHFIKSKVNLKQNDPDFLFFVNLSKEQLIKRWETPYGSSLLRELKLNNFSRITIEEFIGRYNDHFDFRGIDLSSIDLSRLDLSLIDFYAANLEKTNLTESILTDSWLSEANIKGVRFDWAQMDNVLLDNVEYDRGTIFNGVDIGKVNFTLAALLNDLANSQHRIAHLESKSPFLAFLLKITSDYGRSLTRWGFWCVSVILFFGLLFGIVPFIDKGGILNGIYFSFVTFTTLGYGDILPLHGFGQIIAIIEVCIGYLMGGLFIAILTKKIMG